MDDDRTAALAEIIESLAPIPRLPTSDGEREAAELIRNRFEAAGCASWIEEVPAYPSYARPIGTLCATARWRTCSPATLVSVDAQKLLPNYHLYTDTPENVDYRSVQDAALLTEAVARRLRAIDTGR